MRIKEGSIVARKSDKNDVATMYKVTEVMTGVSVKMRRCKPGLFSSHQEYEYISCLRPAEPEELI